MADEDDKKDPKTEEGTPSDGKAKFMTVEEFNRATSAREARQLKSWQAMLEASFQKFTQPKASDEEETEEEETEEGQDSKGAEDKGEKKKEGKSSSQELAAKRMLAEAKKINKATAMQQEAAKKQQLELAEKEERSAAREALVSAGVTATKPALALLKSEGRITRNKDGEIVFLMPREVGTEKFTEELDIEAGIKEWLDTDDGKLFQPPRGAEGSGATGASKGGGSRKTLSKAERRMAAAQTLQDYLTKRTL